MNELNKQIISSLQEEAEEIDSLIFELISSIKQKSTKTLNMPPISKKNLLNESTNWMYIRLRISIEEKLEKQTEEEINNITKKEQIIIPDSIRILIYTLIYNKFFISRKIKKINKMHD